ncbi:MAG: ABC transporter ATP-binding protein [Candidatus Cyclobacteriaceae bacterium M2_1C_046]
MKPILEIKNISKKFQIRKGIGSYLSLRDKITSSFKRDTKKEDFWALKDVTFDVNPGDSIGIIGKNGAGKSTLLKILSKITPPTSGEIIGRGRIASLLEVGTGFHPELTGRENIFLNGSILGMKRKEILTKFDEIVAFSGTEKFLDTSLKHYSSGMQLRLAFSVAAFLEPEILIIDEVLAVGDMEFQKKCLGKMDEVSKSGRTILFVSHNITAVESLCPHSILLEKGQLVIAGKSNEVIKHYLSSSGQKLESQQGVINFEEKTTGLIKEIRVLCDNKPSNIASMGSKIQINVDFKSEEELDFPVLGLIFRDMQNAALLAVNNKHYVGNLTNKPLSEGSISFTIPYLPLMSGIYSIDVHFGNGYVDLDVKKDCITLLVEPKKFTNAGELPDEKYNRIFVKDIEWSINK